MRRQIKLSPLKFEFIKKNIKNFSKTLKFYLENYDIVNRGWGILRMANLRLKTEQVPSVIYTSTVEKICVICKYYNSRM